MSTLMFYLLFLGLFNYTFESGFDNCIDRCYASYRSSPKPTHVPILPKIANCPNQILTEKLPLKQTDVWKRWEKPPVPIYIKFWVFNVDNPHEVLYDHKKPNLTVKGPYIYEEIRFKVNVNPSYDGKSITYNEYKEFKFNEKMTNKNNGTSKVTLLEDDEVTVINMPMLEMANAGLVHNKTVDGLFDTIKEILNAKNSEIEYDCGLFTKQKVGQLFVTGYTHKGLEKLLEKIPGLTAFGLSDKFGAFYDEHRRTGKTWTIDNGADNNMKNYLEVNAYDGDKELNSWKPKSECNKLKGTDGTQFPPCVAKSNPLYVFNEGICRSVYLNFWKEESVHDINVWRFRIPKKLFANPMDKNGHLTGENACYCMYTGDEIHRCNRTGVMDITTCPKVSKFAPMIMSEPHFHYGDPQLREPFNGLKDTGDDDDNYGTVIDVEPMTGTVLRSYKRIQVNAGIFRIKGISALDKNLPKTLEEKIFPMLWFEESFEYTNENAKHLKDEFLSKIKH